MLHGQDGCTTLSFLSNFSQNKGGSNGEERVTLLYPESKALTETLSGVPLGLTWNSVV